MAGVNLVTDFMQGFNAAQSMGQQIDQNQTDNLKKQYAAQQPSSAAPAGSQGSQPGSPDYSSATSTDPTTDQKKTDIKAPTVDAGTTDFWKGNQAGTTQEQQPNAPTQTQQQQPTIQGYTPPGDTTAPAANLGQMPAFMAPGQSIDQFHKDYADMHKMATGDDPVDSQGKPLVSNAIVDQTTTQPRPPVDTTNKQPVLQQYESVVRHEDAIQKKISYNDGLAEFLDSKGKYKAADEVRHANIQLQNEAAQAKVNTLHAKALTLDAVGGLVRMARTQIEEDPSQENVKRVMADLQLKAHTQYGYDDQIIPPVNKADGTIDVNKVLAAAKGFERSTLTGAQNARLEMDSQKLQFNIQKASDSNYWKGVAESDKTRAYNLSRDKFELATAKDIVNNKIKEANFYKGIINSPLANPTLIANANDKLAEINKQIPQLNNQFTSLAKQNKQTYQAPAYNPSASAIPQETTSIATPGAKPQTTTEKAPASTTPGADKKAAAPAAEAKPVATGDTPVPGYKYSPSVPDATKQGFETAMNDPKAKDPAVRQKLIEAMVSKGYLAKGEGATTTTTKKEETPSKSLLERIKGSDKPKQYDLNTDSGKLQKQYDDLKKARDDLDPLGAAGDKVRENAKSIPAKLKQATKDEFGGLSLVSGGGAFDISRKGSEAKKEREAKKAEIDKQMADLLDQIKAAKKREAETN